MANPSFSPRHISIACIIVCCGFTHIFSQDTLTSENKDTSGQLTINIATDDSFQNLQQKVASFMSDQQPDSAMILAQQAFARAEDLGLPYWKGVFRRLQGEIYESQGMYEEALEAFESALNWMIESGDLKGIEIFYRDIGQVLINAKLLDSNIVYQEKRMKELQLSRQRYAIVAIGGGLISTIAFALFIFHRLRLTRRQKSEIEVQKKRAELSEKHKELFLANMSHEIRTPMHAISGMTKILKRKTHNAELDQYLDAIDSSAENLLVILNDVLDISKIEAGELEIHKKPMDLRVVIQNVYQLLRFKAEAKGLEFRLEIDDAIPSLIVGDPARINQILVNLVGNAIKFTPKGHVYLSVYKSDDTLNFRITDTGIGISADKLSTIFESFHQADLASSGKFGGTGLGLSISKYLIEKHGGTVSIESALNEGTTVMVYMPLIEANQEKISTRIVSEEMINNWSVELTGLAVLVAEDNDFNQMIVRADLEHYIPDVSITIVPNGEEAVEIFKREKFDIILMDIHMPGMNGHDATKAIRNVESEGPNKPTPIIAMTASLLSSEIDACYVSGMDNYIPKPYSTEQFLGTIHHTYFGLKAKSK